MNVGRKRTLRPDLPPGLIFDSEWQTYQYCGTRGGERIFNRKFGAVLIDGLFIIFASDDA